MVEEVKVPEFKVVVMGEKGSGKSSLITRISQDRFNPDQQPTFSASYSYQTLEIDSNNIKLQIWDLAGGKQFISLAPIYSQSADGFIFVYDATSRASFDGLNEWITKIEANCPDNISRVVVAAKGDLKDDRQVTKDEGQAYAT